MNEFLKPLFKGLIYCIIPASILVFIASLYPFVFFGMCVLMGVIAWAWIIGKIIIETEELQGHSLFEDIKRNVNKLKEMIGRLCQKRKQ